MRRRAVAPGEVMGSHLLQGFGGRLGWGFPLPAACMLEILSLCCGRSSIHGRIGIVPLQIDALAPPGPPATAMAGEWDATGASAAHVRVRHPAAAALLLRMAAEPGVSAAERAAVLQLLLLLCSSASLSQQAQQANQDQLLAAPSAWQQHLLDCLSQAAGSSAGSGGSSGKGSSPASGDPSQAAAQEAAAAAAWRLLTLLLARGIAASPIGWQLLQATVSLLKAQPGRTYLAPDYGARSSASGAAAGVQLVPTDSWHLLQALIADVVLDLLAAQAADAATAAHAAGSSSSSAVATSPTPVQGRPGARRTSSEWDAWTLVSQVNLQFSQLLGMWSRAGCMLHAPPSAALMGTFPAPLPQWSTEPYCSNAAALLSLVDDFLGSGVVAPSGGLPSPRRCWFPTLQRHTVCDRAGAAGT